MTKTMLVLALVVVAAVVIPASATDAPTYDGADSWHTADIFSVCSSVGDDNIKNTADDSDTGELGETCCGTVADGDRVAFCTDPTYPNKYKDPNVAAGSFKMEFDSFSHCKADPCDATDAEDRFSCCRTTKACFGEGSESKEMFDTSIEVMSYIGLFVCAIPSIILGSLPACCGKMVDKRMMLGGIGFLLGFLALISPIAAGSTAGGTACSATCEDGEHCGPCSQEEKDVCTTFLGALGIIVALFIGAPAVILGIVGLSISGAAMCGCCKAATPPAAVGAAVVTAQKA